jgi:hypothetical protein
MWHGSLINRIRVIDVLPDLHRRIMEKLVPANLLVAVIMGIEVSDVVDADVVASEPLDRL